MTSVDTNVLFSALVADDANHEAAAALLSREARNAEFVLAEQTLVELYGLLRNPALMSPPLTGAQAVAAIRSLKSNPDWMIVDVPEEPSVMDRVWRAAAKSGFARRRIHDLRLAETLLFWKVDRFYTRNVRDFSGVGFGEVINPFE